MEVYEVAHRCSAAVVGPLSEALDPQWLSL